MSAKSPPPLPITPKCPQWEYKVLEEKPSTSNALESRLNTLGREGWEVISVFTPSASYRLQVLLKRRSSR